MPDVGHDHTWVETRCLDVGQTLFGESLGQLSREVDVGKFAVGILLRDPILTFFHGIHIEIFNIEAFDLLMC